MTVKELKEKIDDIAEHEPDITVIVDGVQARWVDLKVEGERMFVEIS